MFVRDSFDLVALGTPVIDVYAAADEEMIRQLALVKSSTNFVDFYQLEQMKQSLCDRIFLSAPGDNARNVCEVFAKLDSLIGNSFRVAYIGSLAQDDNGKTFKRSLDENKIADFTVTLEGATGEIISLITPDSERTFVAYLGVGEDIQEVSALRSVSFFCTTITLLSSGTVSKVATSLMEDYLDYGSRLILSLESPSLIVKNKSKVLKMCESASILFGNEQEFMSLGFKTKDYGSISELCDTVYIKRGSKGSVLIKDKRVFEIPPFRVEKTIDSTGCGDNFIGTVIWSLLKGLTHIEAAIWGNYVGALTTSVMGTSLDPAAMSCIPYRSFTKRY